MIKTVDKIAGFHAGMDYLANHTTTAPGFKRGDRVRYTGPLPYERGIVRHLLAGGYVSVDFDGKAVKCSAASLAIETEDR